MGRREASKGERGSFVADGIEQCAHIVASIGFFFPSLQSIEACRADVTKDGATPRYAMVGHAGPSTGLDKASFQRHGGVVTLHW